MNLMEGLLQQIKRLREDVMPAYEEIGPAGAIALHLMKASVALAEKVIGEGDTVAMMACYKDLEGYKL